MTKPIVNLSDYNPYWEKEFEIEKNNILEVLGDKAVGIEHIGSTSIKGLQAKPIIDLMVGVQHLEEVSHYISLLSQIDYEYVPKAEFKDRKFFRKGSWGQGTSHLHICEIHGGEWTEKLLFRDYLRVYPEVAEEYASLKRELASKHQFDRPIYTKKKEPFIKSIIEKAEKEIHGQ
ncbi:MAG: GrpB family protein [Anaerobacillus sp.]